MQPLCVIVCRGSVPEYLFERHCLYRAECFQVSGIQVLYVTEDTVCIFAVLYSFLLDSLDIF